MAKLDTKTSDEKAHAEFSASGSARWLNCPGSIALSKQAPEQRESPAALEGTRAHACLELILRNRKKIGAAIKMAEKEYPEEGMIDHAITAVEYIESRLSEYPEAKLLIEEEIDSSPFTCEGQFGTLDAAIVSEFDRLIVIDYKYGAGVVVDPQGEDDRGNSQLVYYALGLSHKYNHNFSEVELVVIQPRAFVPDGNTIRSAVYTMDELLSWEQVFLDGVKKAKDPLAKHSAGSWCKFCPATLICPEVKDKAFKQAQIVFSDEKGLELIPEPKVLKVDNLGTILDACDKLDAWIEKVREYAHVALTRGFSVPGYKLVNKNAIRKWADIEKTTAEAHKRFGDGIFTKPELLSPAQLEKQFKIKDDWVDSRTVKKSSGTTVVKESDKRPAIPPPFDVVKTFEKIAPQLKEKKK